MKVSKTLVLAAIVVAHSFAAASPSGEQGAAQGIPWALIGQQVFNLLIVIGGLSFLPRSNHVYQLAPYEEITKEKYEEMLKKFENVDYSKLMTYELRDETEQKKELACSSGVCEI